MKRCFNMPGFLELIQTPRLLITCGVMWTPYDWLIKLYSCCMAAVVVINDGRGLKS